MNDILTEVKFWSMVIESQRQTIMCSPELESRVKGYIDARGLGYLLTVKVSPYVGDNQILVFNDQAIEAMTNEWLSRPIRLI